MIMMRMMTMMRMMMMITNIMMMMITMMPLLTIRPSPIMNYGSMNIEEIMDFTCLVTEMF